MLTKIDAVNPRLIVFDVFYPKAQASADLAAFSDDVSTEPSDLQKLANTMKEIGERRPLIIGPVGSDPALAPLRAILAKRGENEDWSHEIGRAHV